MKKIIKTLVLFGTIFFVSCSNLSSSNASNQTPSDAVRHFLESMINGVDFEDIKPYLYFTDTSAEYMTNLETGYYVLVALLTLATQEDLIEELNASTMKESISADGTTATVIASFWSDDPEEAFELRKVGRRWKILL